MSKRRDIASEGGEPHPGGGSPSRATGIRITGAQAATPAASGGEGDAAAADAWIGRVVDERYRVVEKLGEGGMGAVFVAEHLKLLKPVALKIILPAFAGDGEMAARFAREAMASAKLDHPHVASALDYGTLPEGGAYLVMQLVRGRSLQATLDAEGRLPWPRACAIAAQVADALAAAHSHGIVHRDLKPDNVLLEPRDGGGDLVKVLDFGIARIMAETGKAVEGAAPARALTRLGTVMGTPGYMAPEQAMGDAVDHRADIYALGVVLWETLTGKTLFEGDELTAIVTKQLTEEPPTASQASGDASIPAALDALVTRMLDRSAGSRPQSAAEVRDALGSLALGGAAAASLPAGSMTGAHSLSDPRPEATARTLLARERTPTARTARTHRSWLGRIPDAVTLGGRRIALPVLAAAIAGPIVLGVLAALLAVAFTPGKDGATHPAQRIAKLLDPAGAFPLVRTTPPDVQKRIDTLLKSDGRSERRRAAQWLVDHEPAADVPHYARQAADLELARTCRAKVDVLDAMREAGDGRVLPALERIDAMPKRGCGFLRLNDCYGCLRDDLAETMAALK